MDAEFFNSTAGLSGFKGSLKEGGIRVPMIARLPGVVPVTVNDTPGYFADWMPTLCAAAGLEPAPGSDGENLWPAMLSGKKPAERKPMVWVFPEYGGQAAVRLGNFKVIREKLNSRKPGPWRVHDIEADPAETTDLSATRGDLIEQAVAILRGQTSANQVFPTPRGMLDD